MMVDFCPWWRHEMETFSALLALVTGDRWPVNSTHKGQWRGALVFPLICAWTNAWVNNREAGDLRRHCAHYDVIVMHRQNTHYVESVWPDNRKSVERKQCNALHLTTPTVIFEPCAYMWFALLTVLLSCLVYYVARMYMSWTNLHIHIRYTGRIFNEFFNRMTVIFLLISVNIQVKYMRSQFVFSWYPASMETQITLTKLCAS